MKVRDVLIQKGIITDIKAKLSPPRNTLVLDPKNLHISKGWIDIGCFNGEPGFEHQEDLVSLKSAGAAGGYVSLAPFPTTQPCLDSKSQIEAICAKNNNHLVQILPIANLTKDGTGQEISEILDLLKAGAIAFSDGNAANLSEGQVQRSLLYLKAKRGIAILPLNHSNSGQVNEGDISIKMGVEGIPEHLEEVEIDKILHQLKYTNSGAVIHNVSLGSTADKIQKIAQNYNCYGSVAAMNLAHNDHILNNWDTNYKVIPPLRSETERRKLCRAVQKGSIDIIASNHHPVAEEDKDEPFGLSPFGASTLETTFSSIITYAEEISLERVVECLAQGPALALGIEQDNIAIGQEANITLFDPQLKWEVKSSDLKSKSLNNPYIGATLRGRSLGVIHKTQYILNELT